MSYLVLARKWRPTVFENVVGQNHVTTTLKNAITAKRIAHAYLFSGAGGVGKTTIARILAKALNCAQGPTPLPCNECQSCKEITANISVDVIEIDGASNTGVDNVREIRENVKYLPSHGRYRVYIIDEVHMLSTQAFNALLKTLEEPPSHAIFIFATTEPHKIPATIQSRCQRFDFKRIALKEIQNHLKHVAETEGITISDGGVYLIAKEVEGSLRDAHSLLDQVIAFAGNTVKENDVIDALGLMDRSLLFQLSEAIIQKNGGECLKLVEKVYNFGYDLKRFCQNFLEHTRDLVVVKVVDNPEDILEMPDSEIGDLKKLAQRVSIQELHMMFSLLSKGYEDISRSVSPRHAFEMTLLKMVHLENLQPIDTLLAKLDELKGAGGSASLRAFDQEPSASAEKAKPGKENSKVSDCGLQAFTNESPVTYSPIPVREASDSQWQDLLDFLRKKRAPLASHVELVSRHFIEKGMISLEIKDGPYLSYITENKKVLEQMCSEFFGREMSVVLKAGKVAGIPPQKQQDDAVVTEAVKIFGGKILEDRRSRSV